MSEHTFVHIDLRAAMAASKELKAMGVQANSGEEELRMASLYAGGIVTEVTSNSMAMAEAKCMREVEKKRSKREGE